ncbi:TPA: hypothetical protein ACHGD0_005678, partial [Escherichia coli]
NKRGRPKLKKERWNNISKLPPSATRLRIELPLNQQVTAVTAPASSTGGLIALSLHKQERRARC